MLLHKILSVYVKTTNSSLDGFIMRPLKTPNSSYATLTIVECQNYVFEASVAAAAAAAAALVVAEEALEARAAYNEVAQVAKKVREKASVAFSKACESVLNEEFDEYPLLSLQISYYAAQVIASADRTTAAYEKCVALDAYSSKMAVTAVKVYKEFRWREKYAAETLSSVLDEAEKVYF
jgi:hypothetical protein